MVWDICAAPLRGKSPITLVSWLQYKKKKVSWQSSQDHSFAQVSQCGRMLQKSIGGGRTRSPLKSVQLARENLAQVGPQQSSNQILKLGQQRWANLEKERSSSEAPKRLTVKDVSSVLASSPKRSSAQGKSKSSILGSSSRLLESSASVAIVPSKRQPTSGEADF